MLAVLVLVGALAAAASAEIVSSGDVTAAAWAKLEPSKLPPSAAAPVALTLGFSSRSAGGGEVPGLERISLNLANAVSFDAVGLPACPVSALYDTYGGEGACRGSLVGSGAVDSEIVTPGQGPVAEEGQLRAYLGRYRGTPAILAQVKTGDPLPLVYVIPFHLWEGEGRHGDRLVAYKMHQIHGKCLGPCPGPGPYSFEGIYTHISRFEMTLRRTWSRAGRAHSFLAATCPAPPDRRRKIELLSAQLSYEASSAPPLTANATRTCRASA